MPSCVRQKALRVAMCSFSFCHCASPTTRNAADATRGAGPSFSGAADTSGGGGGVVVSEEKSALRCVLPVRPKWPFR